MKKETTPDIWDRIDSLIGEASKPIQPDEFTISQYANMARKKGKASSVENTRKKLRELSDQGILERRMTIINGRHVTVFRFAK